MDNKTRHHAPWRHSAVVLHAEVCKSLAHPIRLVIIDLLNKREQTVSELGQALHLPKANVSQHLGVLRQQGLVDVERAGRFLRCRLTSAKIPKACALMREVLLEQLEKKNALVRMPEGRRSIA